MNCMNRKKVFAEITGTAPVFIVLALLVTLGAFVFSSCATMSYNAEQKRAASLTVATLDKDLDEAYVYIKDHIAHGSKVAFLNMQSDNPQLSRDILDGLIRRAVNDKERPRPLSVVDRQNLEAIQKEMDFQLSGEVSDASQQEIGQKLGAQTIVSGSITRIGGSMYRLRLRAMEVESALVKGLFIKNGSVSGGALRPDPLDQQIRVASDYLNEQLNPLLPQFRSGIKIAIDVRSRFPRLLDYVSDELTRNTVDDGIFSVADRYNLDVIKKEMDFQLSGETSDATTQEIGQKAGAQIMVIGEITKDAGGYRLAIRAITVEKAEVEALEIFNFRSSPIADILTQSDIVAETVAENTERKEQQAAEAAERRAQNFEDFPRRHFPDLEIAIGANIGMATTQNPALGESDETQIAPSFDVSARFYLTPNIAIFGEYAGAPGETTFYWKKPSGFPTDSAYADIKDTDEYYGNYANYFIAGVDATMYLNHRMSLVGSVGFSGFIQKFENEFKTDKYRFTASRSYFGPGVGLAAKINIMPWLYLEAGARGSFYLFRISETSIEKGEQKYDDDGDPYTSWSEAWAGPKANGSSEMIYIAPYLIVGINVFSLFLIF